MFKRVVVIIMSACIIFIASFFVAYYFFSQKNPPVIQITQTIHEPIVFVTSTVPVVTTTQKEEEQINSPEKEIPEPVKSDVLPKKVLLKVPFTPQAPFADWSDPRQQDGCEEASVVMAEYWFQGKELSRQEALTQILALSDWEKEHYGNSRDTSAEDTLKRLLQEYYRYPGGRVEYDITVDALKYELAAGNILIIPFNGQVLANPNFKSPGPERHMLVVIGYDDEKGEFITNDPGTRLGQGFVYSYENFAASFRDYKTGNHVPIEEERSAMIVIESVVQSP